MATWKKVITDGLSLTDIGTPASDDKVLIQDTSDSDIVKYVDFGDIGGGGGTTTTTPTIATISDFESTTTGTMTVSNYSSDNEYRIILYDSSDAVVNHTITDNSDGTFTIASGLAVGNDYYITVEAVGFGELKSAVATSNDFDSQAAATQKRYYRIVGTDSSKNPVSSKFAIGDLRYFTGANATGTQYPATDATSETSISGVTISKGYEHSSTYAAWRIVDINKNLSAPNNMISGLYWTIGNSVAANNWVQIDFGTSITFASARLRYFPQYTDATTLVVYGSNTGNFSGEEREMCVFSNVDSGSAAAELIEAIT